MVVTAVDSSAHIIGYRPEDPPVCIFYVIPHFPWSCVVGPMQCQNSIHLHFKMLGRLWSISTAVHSKGVMIPILSCTPQDIPCVPVMSCPEHTGCPCPQCPVLDMPDVPVLSCTYRTSLSCPGHPGHRGTSLDIQDIPGHL